MSKKIIKLLTYTLILLVTLTTSLVLYKATAKPSVFLTTTSPRGTYEVNLTGQKERPIFFNAEVRFSVLKNEKPLVTNQYLHSGDAFDLSFEAGYPDHRWIDENILHFYREQYFNAGAHDSLVIANKTNKVVKYLRIYSLDKFLLFDIRPGSETTLSAAPPRGDFTGFSVEGELYEGQKLKKGESFAINKEAAPFTYYISITDDGLAIESPKLEKYKP